MKLFRRVPENPDMEDVLELAISDFLEELHTCIPGRITSYDAATQKANVQPVVSDHYWDPDEEELVPEKLPICPCVPVVWPSADGSSITFPLKKGDPVLLVFSERSVAEYLLTGNKDNEPSSARAFDLSDAFAIPGGRSFNASSAHAAPIPGDGLDEVAVVVRGKEVCLRAEDGFSFEAGGEELLAVVEALRAEVSTLTTHVATLAGSTVATAIGSQPLSTAATVVPLLGNVQTALGGILTQLAKLKR